MLTLAVTKFVEGAWIIIIVIPVLVTTFRLMHRHYTEVAAELSLAGNDVPPELHHTVLILVGDLHRGVVRALQYAKTLAAPSVAIRGVYVELDPDRTYRLEEKWGQAGLGIPLVVLNSPYRSLLRPLLHYIDEIQARGQNEVVTIVLPESCHDAGGSTSCIIKQRYWSRPPCCFAEIPSWQTFLTFSSDRARGPCCRSIKRWQLRRPAPLLSYRVRSSCCSGCRCSPISAGRVASAGTP